MSFPDTIHIPLTNDHIGKKQTQLRTVRLTIPSDLPQSLSPLGPHYAPPAQSFSNYRPSSPQVSEVFIDRNRSGRISLVAPSLFYRFIPGVEASFKIDILVSSNTSPFIVQPPTGVQQLRFLLFPVCVAPISTSPVKFILNGNQLHHWATDSRPIDVTSMLMPFGQQNWLIVETGVHMVPFSIVGVWMEYRSFDDIAQEISKRGTFQFNDYTSLCPLTGMQIEIPARGINCQHSSCFDLLPFLSQCQALTEWVCPICGNNLPYSELRIGAQQESQVVEQNENLTNENQIFQLPSMQDFDWSNSCNFDFS